MIIGEHIGKYIITEPLHGGMSEVYRVALDGSPVRFVLKRLKEGASEEQKRLFKREMRILRKLKHNNIIEMIDEHYDDVNPYYVMPSCGKSLVDIATSAKSDDRLKLNLAIQMCEGIYLLYA